MTTSKSPLSALRRQSDDIACMLKAAERGEKVAKDPLGKIAASIATGSVTFGVAMDDKFVKITMPWDVIRSTSEAGISEYVLKYMRGSRETTQ